MTRHDVEMWTVKISMAETLADIDDIVREVIDDMMEECALLADNMGYRDIGIDIRLRADLLAAEF